MKKIIGILIIFMILHLAGCTGTTALTDETVGTIVNVWTEPETFTEDEQVVVEFGNDSKGIISFTRIDPDGIDWYEYLRDQIGEKVRIRYIVNTKRVAIISVEILN